MSVWPLIEPLLVALVVLLSALQALRRLWPTGWTRARRGCARWLLRSDRPAWLARIGRRLAPAPIPAARAASGCGPCRGCDSGR